MNLKDINTSRFLADPNKDDFVDRMTEMSPVFNFNISRVNHKKALTYIALMYDKESYFRKDIKRYLERKYKSGIAAGFSVDDDGTFHEKAVEKMLLGGFDDFNKAVVQYAVLQYDLDYARLVVFELNLHKFLLKAMTKMDEKGDLKKQMDALTKDINDIEKRIFGGDETINMRKALYEGTSQTRLRLRPEDALDEFKVTGLADWSPYGKGYKPEGIKFVGDTIPETDDS